MSGKARNYTDEFKLQIVSLVKSGKTSSIIAKEYGIAKSSVTKWVIYFNKSGSFKIFKTEFVTNKTFNSLHELNFQLSDYVHWFNNFSIHGSLGYLSPVDFKKLHLAK